MTEAIALARHYWDVFVLAFVAIAVCESVFPQFVETRPTVRRWGRNLSLAALGATVGLGLRVSPLVIASVVADRPWGVLNHVAAPFALRLLAGVLMIDLFRYVQHRLLHQVPLLWRVHQVHHADEHFDLTTGLRFHPLEALVTHVSYMAFVALIAPPIEAVLIALFLAMLQNLFAHANVRIPHSVDRVLRRVVITPEMHRVHHSVQIDEQNTNFGSVVPFWDRAFGTYLPTARAAGDGLRFGLRELAGTRSPSVMSLLAMPFAVPGALGTHRGDADAVPEEAGVSASNGDGVAGSR